MNYKLIIVPVTKDVRKPYQRVGSISVQAMAHRSVHLEHFRSRCGHHSVSLLQEIQWRHSRCRTSADVSRFPIDRMDLEHCLGIPHLPEERMNTH